MDARPLDPSSPLPESETFTIHVYVRSDSSGLHLDCTGLEPGRSLQIHIQTPAGLGMGGFIGTLTGVRALRAEEFVGDALKKLQEETS
jgi:hypothetical protein